MVAFDAEIFNPDPPRMVPDTRKIVTALQNTTLHPLDLLVRESVQNSLDAAIDDDPTSDVRIEFKRGTFDTAAFAETLGLDCSGRLRSWLANHAVGDRYIAVRDSHCTGLTGDPKDPMSNVYKLVYGFLDGKDEDNAGAGGSYGVGKTVFLHFGIGFVCYYSRIGSKQRLSMFYCRNGINRSIFEKSFMPYQLAWWGKRDPNSRNGAVYPIEDDYFIEEFLKVFDIKPYGRNETGTTVIVPFFDEKVAVGEQNQFTPWLDSVDDYLRYSFLKWYAPRFRRDLKELADEGGGVLRDYGWGRYLRCRFPDGKNISLVSNESVSVAERKIFGLIRDLYDVAREKVRSMPDTYRIPVTHRDAPSKGVYFRTPTIGWLAIRKINYLVGEFKDTLTVLRSLAPEGEIEDRKGFILYCRKPGMIMTYDESWGKVLSQAKRSMGEFFIGVFVVNSENSVRSSLGSYGSVIPLDQLFRETEKSDHYGWPTDAASHGLKLINTIVNKLKSEVAQKYADFEAVVDKRPKGDISRGLGAVFMSGRMGFGETRLFPEGNGGVDERPEPRDRSQGSRVRRTRIVIGDPAFAVNGEAIDVSVPILVTAAEKDASVRLEIAVEADGSPITAMNWNSSDGEFPISVIDFVNKPKDETRTVSVKIDEVGVAVDLDFSQACNIPVECLLTYTVNRTDMSTLVMRKGV